MVSPPSLAYTLDCGGDSKRLYLVNTWLNINCFYIELIVGLHHLPLDSLDRFTMSLTG